MKKLWNFVKVRFRMDKAKQNVFLFLNTILWSVTAFLLWILVGLLFSPLESKLIWNALIAAGYAGFFGGFIGGCIFLMNTLD